jgi:hypothetical protein
MRTTWNFKPAAVAMVKRLARKRRISEGEAASRLILNGGAAEGGTVKELNGVKLAPDDGVPITSAEVRAALYDA